MAIFKHKMRPAAQPPPPAAGIDTERFPPQKQAQKPSYNFMHIY